VKQVLSNLLAYPFDDDLSVHVAGTDKVLFLNSLPVFSFNMDGDFDVLTFYANDKARWNKGNILQKLGGNKYDKIFCTLSKNKTECYYFIALIVKHLSSEGEVVISASNDLGGKNLSKWMKEYGFEGEDFSKKKCRIFVGKLVYENIDLIEKSLKEGAVHNISLGNRIYKTQAGIFGWNKVDQGSKLLIQEIKDDLSGVGADFGCGYGYLSDQILLKHKNIKKLYAIDVDSRAVSCARDNLEKFDAEVLCHWADLTKPFPFKEKLHWIVMNPPFHEGKERDEGLGKVMIERTHDVLGKGCALYMVANRHLPYEKTLSIFSSVEKLKEENGFKVYKAIK
jgi:16S rRNA (guanine1207-N2)-methyltransferase